MNDQERQTLRMLLPNFTAEPGLIVARGKLPEDLRAEVEASESVKLLVAGQRGMGKTTELRRLSGLLTGGDILPVFIQFGSQESITHSMLIRAMGHALREAVGQKLSVKVAGRFEQWFAEESEVLEVEEGAEGSAGIGGKVLVVEAGERISHKRRKTTTKKVTNPRRINDLIGAFNELIVDARRVSKRRIVFIVDDIDKIQDVASIESTFVTSSHVVGAIEATCIFTVPITYATSSSVRLATLAYGQIYLVPAVEVVDPEGRTNQAAVEFMEEVLKRRMPFNPIPADVLQRIVVTSGGVHIDAMRLARGLCKKAVLTPGFRIDEAALEDEVQGLVDDYKFVLDTPELWKSLGDICGDKRKALLSDRNLPALLYKLIVVEYRDRKVWFDAHPAARRLYEQNSELLGELL